MSTAKRINFTKITFVNWKYKEFCVTIVTTQKHCNPCKVILNITQGKKSVRKNIPIPINPFSEFTKPSISKLILKHQSASLSKKARNNLFYPKKSKKKKRWWEVGCFLSPSFNLPLIPSGKLKIETSDSSSTSHPIEY